MFSVLGQGIQKTKEFLCRVCVTILKDKDLSRGVEGPAISAQMPPPFMVAKNARGKDLAP